MSEKIAFTMNLKPGCAKEYRKRHDEIWPELVELLRNTGVSDYSIFLNEANMLFAVLSCNDEAAYQALPQNPLMQRWWDYMAPLMEVLPNNEPVCKRMTEVFYLK